MLMRKELVVALFLTAVIGVSAESDSRERELAYLRTILPDSLLKYAHLEVASTASIIIYYLKLGMYRHPDIDTDNWIYIDGVQISKDAKP